MKDLPDDWFPEGRKGHVSDDISANISPAMYDRFSRPFHDLVFQRYGGGGLHNCGPNPCLAGYLSHQPAPRSLDLNYEYSKHDLVAIKPLLGRALDNRAQSADSSAEPLNYCFGFSGETYDATRETRGWDAAGFDDTGWNRVNCVPMPTAEVRARMVEPNRIRAVTKPAGRERIEGMKSRADLLAILNRYGLYNGGTTFGPGV